MEKEKYSSDEALSRKIARLRAELEALEKEQAEKTLSSDTPIWNILKRNYPYGTMPKEKQDCVESTVAQLLETGEHADEPGLLLGKIQCGKTDTFEDIIGLAFDKGIDIAIVITKGTKALTNQTIMRMKKDYRWFKASDNLAPRSTINIYDIMAIGRDGFKQAMIESGKTVIVCKKQAKNMERLAALFEHKSPFLKKKKVLVVDDEADFASRNYRSVKQEARIDENGTPVAQTKEVTMAKISQQIDDFRKIPEFCRYLQVTATPYCLYLQPQGELNLNGDIVKPFKPRFTSLVPSHERYVGGQQFFVEAVDPDSMYSHLYHPLDQKCIDVLGHEDKRYLKSNISSDNISGLTYSLVAYFMATAIRRIQERIANNIDSYKTSAIFHVEISKKNHDWQRRLIESLIDAIKSVIIAEDHSDERVYSVVESCYQDFVLSNEKGRKEGLIDVKVPSLKDVLNGIKDIFSTSNYVVRMVNSDEEVANMLNEETGELKLDYAANIFIGGNILDRGVTIKNMLCFFYGRDPRNFQQDTVLQHARMYGARSKEDMAVMRLHTTPLIYGILVRMNELDEQLRQWFIEGKDKQGSNAVFVGYDEKIRPCASSKIKISNTQLLLPQKRFLPVGFWTLGKTAIKKPMEQIRELIVNSPGYSKKDADGLFEMEKDRVVEIIKLIESTYVYNDKLFNSDRKNDIKEMLCALDYCTGKSDGRIWVLHRENRNLNRIRENGGFIDAPDDGRTDLAPAHAKATDTPVVMFIQQNGAKCMNGDKNIGWNGAPFYWPVLLTQENITTVMFALDQKAKGQIATIDNSDFFEGYDPKDILTLTFKGNLEERFGEVGSEYEYGDECPYETRVLKQTTAGKYILKDEHGNWKLNPKVAFDKKHDHGLYSLNKGKFPFVIRPYKYLCLRNGRDARADIMLLELFEPDLWRIYPTQNFSPDGALIDRDTLAVLTHAQDTIISKNLDRRDVMDETNIQWEIKYPIKKVLKLKRGSAIDWNAVFGENED